MPAELGAASYRELKLRAVQDVGAKGKKALSPVGQRRRHARRLAGGAVVAARREIWTTRSRPRTRTRRGRYAPRGGQHPICGDQQHRDVELGDVPGRPGDKPGLGTAVATFPSAANPRVFVVGADAGDRRARRTGALPSEAVETVASCRSRSTPTRGVKPGARRLYRNAIVGADQDGGGGRGGRSKTGRRPRRRPRTHLLRRRSGSNAVPGCSPGMRLATARST